MDNRSQEIANMQQEIAKEEAEIATLYQEITELTQKLEDLNSDYQTLQECKQKLAESSVFLGDLVVQCDDIDNIFNREIIEEKYDSYHIYFEVNSELFDYLDKISSSIDSFDTSCGDTKSKIDDYGVLLDDCCIDIANEALVVSETIRQKDNSRNQLVHSVATMRSSIGLS